MAVVRFSQELKDAILKNARAVFDKQITVAQDARPSHDWGDKIYTQLFGQHVAVLNAVPSEFLYMIDNIEVQNVGSLRCGLKFNFASPRAWTREFQTTEFARKSSSYGNDIDLKDHLVWGELFADVKRWRDGIKAVEEKRDAFVAQVSKIIEAHATLAPALKMWPALWDLIPEGYKDKHREVKERTKKEVEVDVDLGSLTAAVTFNKLTR